MDVFCRDPAIVAAIGTGYDPQPDHVEGLFAKFCLGRTVDASGDDRARARGRNGRVRHQLARALVEPTRPVARALVRVKNEDARIEFAGHQHHRLPRSNHTWFGCERCARRKIPGEDRHPHDEEAESSSIHLIASVRCTARLVLAERGKARANPGLSSVRAAAAVRSCKRLRRAARRRAPSLLPFPTRGAG